MKYTIMEHQKLNWKNILRKKGIEKLKGSDWKDVEYKGVKKIQADEKKLIKPLEYLSASQEWDKEEGPSKAKSRIRKYNSIQ